MATLSSIRTDLLTLLRETAADGHFTTAQLNNFINEALPLIAPRVHEPRKFDSGTQAVQGTADITKPTDYISLKSAYFGDKSILGDVAPLIPVKEEGLKYMSPSWIETGSGAQGQPRYILDKDETTLTIFPTPDAASSATGKKLWLYYIYKPPTLSSDSDVPIFNSVYHDAIKFYAAHLAYLTLEENNTAVLMQNKFDKFLLDMTPSVDVESQELRRFQWGFAEE